MYKDKWLNGRISICLLTFFWLRFFKEILLNQKIKRSVALCPIKFLKEKKSKMCTHCLVYHHALSTRFIVSEGRINVCAVKDEGYNTELLKYWENFTSALSKIGSDTKEIIITSISVKIPYLWMLHLWDSYV